MQRYINLSIPFQDPQKKFFILHELDPADSAIWFHVYKVHAAAQTFNVEHGQAIDVALLVDPLTQIVEDGDFIILHRQRLMFWAKVILHKSIDFE